MLYEYKNLNIYMLNKININKTTETEKINVIL